MRKQIAVLGAFTVFSLMLAACGGATAISTSTSAVSTAAATKAATSGNAATGTVEGTSAMTGTVESTSSSTGTAESTSSMTGTTESTSGVTGTVASTSSVTGTSESMPTSEMTGTSTVATMGATDTVAPTSESMITGTAASMTGTMMPSSNNDIVSALQSLPGSTVIVQALTASGLLSTLQGQGPYTIFVPNDAAFAKVPSATLTGLMNDQTGLKSLLLYHVVQGNLSPADLKDGAMLTTVNGATLKVSVKGSDIYVNDAKVTGSAVNASNGTIYVVDTVLMPPAK